MIAGTEIRLSLDMIDRAKRRLAYQKTAVARLSFDRDSRCADLAKEMQAIMEEKIALLQRKHSTLMAGLQL